MFGVPTMVFNGELFWGGDRIGLLIERIKNPETIAQAWKPAPQMNIPSANTVT